MLKEGLQPIIEKTKGSKEKKLVYATEGSETIKNVATSGKERQAFVLSDEEILRLAYWAIAIESHYGKPMDMEWAKDGNTDKLYVVQARPETLQSQKSASSLKTHKLKESGSEILAGLSIGEAVASGKVCRVQNSQDIVKIQPMALVHYDQLEDREAWQQIRNLTQGYEDKQDYFVENLARGIAKIAASQYPHPVIVRMSDFKTNEYANLIGGSQFEPHEDNPMLGFRGASRYYSDRYRAGFALECRAIKQVREVMGFENVG